MEAFIATTDHATTKPFFGSLQGKLLIAMPGIEDPRFYQAVIVVLEHDAKGAMGLIVNRRLDDLSFSDLMQQVKVPEKKGDVTEIEMALPDFPVHFGGPVEIGRGFILHSPDVMLSHSKKLRDDLALTTSVDMLEAMAKEKGPRQALLALGYAGWGAGQLENEIQDNAWLEAPLENHLIFNVSTDQCWEAALASVGVSLSNLSATSGHA